jgi:hypothetical protein
MTSKNWIAGTIAVAAIAISLFLLFHKPTEKAEKLATDASEALGLRAAEEVTQLIGHKGQVAILKMEIQPGQAPTAVATVEMFRQTLKRHGFAVVRTKALPGGLTSLVMGSGIPGKDYADFVEATPIADAVVTFAGLPSLPPEELEKFQANHPPLVVVDIFGTLKGPLLPELVEKKTVTLAIVPRNATEVEAAGNEARIFERYYKVLRPLSK